MTIIIKYTDKSLLNKIFAKLIHEDYLYKHMIKSCHNILKIN